MKEEDIKKLNIYQKLALITNEIEVVEKKTKVAVSKTSSYKAVAEAEVLSAVKPIEAKYRVYSYPFERKVIDKDTLVKESEYNGNVTKTNTLFMRIETKYRFINIDNSSEYVDIIAYGDGLDTGDKAPGKAMTYSDKYALMKAYKMITGDDPDKEASPVNGYKKQLTQNPLLLAEFEKLILQTNTDREELYKHYKVKSNIEMDDQQLENAIKILNGKLAKQIQEGKGSIF